jgi:hypothetical protein
MSQIRRTAAGLFGHIKNKPRSGCLAGAGFGVFSRSAWVASGAREFPAPAARKEQQSDRQQQQGMQRGARRSGRCTAHVDVCFECHGEVPGVKGLNAKGGE